MPDDNRSDRRDGKPDLDDAIRDVAAEERSSLGEHPDPVTLLDYQQGKLSAARADRVQEHLSLCPECSQAVLDFAAFPHLEPQTEAHRLTPAEVERQRRELQVRLEARKRPAWQRHELLLPLAAAFFVAAVALGVWTADLQRRLDELGAPRGDVHVVGSLRPEGAGTRGGDSRQVPPWAGRLIVYLAVPPGEAEYGAYEVDAVSGAGRRVLSALAVERSPDGLFVLDLPRDVLPPGQYRFQLFGVEDGARRELAAYPLRIVEGGEG